MARKAGFGNVQAIEPWQSAQVGDLTISAAPGKHGVYEVTYVISGGGRSAYFAGDTFLVPELRTLTDRYGPLDVALLRQRSADPDGGQQAGRDERRRGRRAHRRSAPQGRVPQHYAFTGGTIGDLLFTQSEKGPAHFVKAARRLARRPRQGHQPRRTATVPP